MNVSLVDLCLSTIVDNFAKLNNDFKKTKDDYKKREFEFLQRKYSFELLNRLSEKDDLPEEYVDLLVNKYLKFLDTNWFKSCKWDKVTSKFAEIGHKVERIFFQDVYFDEFSEATPWQEIICHLTNLKIFAFHDDCHDSILKNVAKFCHNIEEIDVQNSDTVTFEGIKYFCKNENGKVVRTSLKKLCIARTHIKDDDVKYLLKNLPSLEVIDYPDLPLVLHSLHKNDLQSIDKVEPYSITTLDLMNLAQTPFFVDVLKVCVSVCPHLKCFTCGLVKEEELNYFFNLSNLEELRIESFSDSEININNLLKSKGNKLTLLSIVNCTVSISILAENCVRLKELILNRVNVLCEEDSKPIFNLLSSITFENSNVSTYVNKIGLLLSSSAKLESLSFIGCCLSPEITVAILKCCELYPIKKISFCGSVIEKEFIKELLCNCHTLSYLNIDGCFDNEDEDDILKFAEILPNKPEIDITDHLDISDYDEYLNGNYEFEDDYEYYDEYDDYEYFGEYNDEYDSDDNDDYI